MKLLINIRHFKWLYGFLGLLTLGITSCKKFVTIDPPTDKLTTTTVFSNDESAQAAIRGIYSDAMQSINYFSNGGMSIFPALSADEIIRTTANSTYDPFRYNSLTATDFTILSNIWAKGYFHIYQANIILDNLNKGTNLSEPVKKQLTGEAKFIRAFMHFYLTNLFGDVPLVVNSDYRVNSTIQRSDTTAVYNQIIDDLTDAQNLLTHACFNRKSQGKQMGSCRLIGPGKFV
jgi:hypothetical protein